jgi:F-type H+-transporting ATPase subunit alpha
MVGQIAVLLALTAELFDDVPLERMKDAEQAVRKAAAQIPAEVCDRLDTANNLSDEDRQAIIEIARRALDTFSSDQDAKTEDKTENISKPKEPSGEIS